MRLVTLACTFVVLVTLTAAPARADEPKAVRIGIAATGGYASLHRSASLPGDRGGLVLGGELRVHPSMHGVALAYTHADTVFGPNVNIVDAAYSIRFAGNPQLRGLTGAAYFDVGPALGFVAHAPPARDHAVLGARVSLAFDAQIANVTIGLIFGYRGGVPVSGTPDGWEGAATALLRLGLVFDAPP